MRLKCTRPPAWALWRNSVAGLRCGRSANLALLSTALAVDWWAVACMQSRRQLPQSLRSHPQCTEQRQEKTARCRIQAWGGLEVHRDEQPLDASVHLDNQFGLGGFALVLLLLRVPDGLVQRSWHVQCDFCLCDQATPTPLDGYNKAPNTKNQERNVQ